MTELSLLRHFCCESREAQVGWVADIIRMKVRPSSVRTCVFPPSLGAF